MIGVLAISAISLGLSVKAIAPNALNFGATQLFSITAQYGLGAPSAGGVGFPGGNIPVTLTIYSLVSHDTQVAIQFAASNHEEWSFAGDGNNVQGCGVARTGIFTMTVNGIALAPINATNPENPVCVQPAGYPLSVQQVIVTVHSGFNSISAALNIANSAPATTPPFTDQWYAVPQ